MTLKLSMLKTLTLAIGTAAAMTGSIAQADIDAATRMQQENGVLADYRRLLPLEGGSNFRDMGGYPAADGKHVRKGLLFRSAAPSSLTLEDQAYLAQLGIASVMDLRSQEELDLFPNQWATNAGIDYYRHDYSIVDMMANSNPDDLRDMTKFYPELAYTLKPQLKQYFSLLAEGKAPIVVNCSAGQDRTGVTSALLLSVLGVPRNLVIEDYLLSTDFRRPAIERGNVDLTARAQDNAFAAIMVRYAQSESTHARPLVTADGTPYLEYALRRIEADYGSIEGFMDKELGIDAGDVAQIRTLYLE